MCVAQADGLMLVLTNDCGEWCWNGSMYGNKGTLMHTIRKATLMHTPCRPYMISLSKKNRV